MTINTTCALHGGFGIQGNPRPGRMPDNKKPRQSGVCECIFLMRGSGPLTPQP